MVFVDCWNICNEALKHTISYFKNIPRYRQWGWRNLPLEQYLKGDVLDIGAGRAYYHVGGRSIQGRVILVDPIYENVEGIFKTMINFITINGDGLSLPVRDGSIDTVLSLATIHHIPTKECRRTFLIEIYRSLRLDGVLILTAWSPQRIPVGEEVCDGILISSRFGSRFYHFYSKEELIEDLESIGFRVLRLENFVENPLKPSLTRNLLAVAHKG